MGQIVSYDNDVHITCVDYVMPLLPVILGADRGGCAFIGSALGQ